MPKRKRISEKPHHYHSVESTNHQYRDYDFKVISLYAGIDKQLATERLAQGIVNPCGAAVPPATQADIDGAPHIVAQMGPEAFTAAMEAEPDYNVFLGGRAYDPAPYIAYAIQSLKRIDPTIDVWSSPDILGGFTHMGKIMECGGLCAKPKSGPALATIYADGSFDIKALDPNAKCTSLSVAAHTFYEKTRPDRLFGPGGYLDLAAATYEELADGVSVRCRGGVFHTSAAQGNPYQVKLEAAKVTGYRSFYMGSIRDRKLTTSVRITAILITNSHLDKRNRPFTEAGQMVRWLSSCRQRRMAT